MYGCVVSEVPETDRENASIEPARPTPRRPRWSSARERLALGIGIAVGALTGRAFLGEREAAGTSGIARLLGDAVSGTVLEDGFVWEPSRGFVIDATWGRNVVFGARIQGSGGPQVDVFRASVRTSREGRALGISDVENLSRTPLADETSPIIYGEKVAFVSRHNQKVTGATVLELTQQCAGCTKVREIFAGIFRRFSATDDDSFVRHVVAFGNPPREAELQWFDGALELRTEQGVARYELAKANLVTSSGAAFEATAWTIPAAPRAFFRPTEAAPSAPAQSHRIAGRAGGTPALETTSLRTPAGATLEVATIDTRQLDLHLRGGRRHPRAANGPGANGMIAERHVDTVVARLGARPFTANPGGFVESGRTLVPPSEKPTIVIDESGDIFFGSAATALLTLRVESLAQSKPSPGAQGRLAALCRTAEDRLLFASTTSTAEDFTAALGARCADLVLFEASAQPIVTDAAALANAPPSDDAFFYLTRRDSTPVLGTAPTFDHADGKVPEPSWLPAIHRAKRERKDGTIDFFAIDVTRFEWRILPGTSEGRGHTCEDALEDADRARMLIAIGLGASDTNAARGLAIDGAVVLPFRIDHSVLLTPPRATAPHSPTGSFSHPRSLTLALSVDDLTTAGDAAELVLFAEAGVLRSEARELGAPRPRSAMCMPKVGLLLYAEARMDSPEAIVDELLAAGCRRIVSSDRGRQNAAIFYRAGVDESPSLEPNEVTLVGLEIAAPGRATSLSK